MKMISDWSSGKPWPTLTVAAEPVTDSKLIYSIRFGWNSAHSFVASFDSSTFIKLICHVTVRYGTKISSRVSHRQPFNLFYSISLQWVLNLCSIAIDRMSKVQITKESWLIHIEKESNSLELREAWINRWEEEKPNLMDGIAWSECWIRRL